MDLKQEKRTAEFYKDSLVNDTVDFWMKNAVDSEQGGYFNYIDDDGTVIGTDKPVWVLNRFVWLLSLLYNEIEQRKDWLDTAKWGMDFVNKHCFDTDGRMFFEVTRDGKPIRKRRYIFTEAFGVMALSEYGIACGDEKVIDQAKDLYKLFVHYYQNPELLVPKEYPETRPSKSHAVVMILLAISQQMRKTGKDELYDKMINHCLDEVFKKFMNYEKKALLETVGVNGEFLDYPEGWVVNPGHAIETAWFIMEEGRYRGDNEIIEKGMEILDWSLDIGWDKDFGGILYFVDVDGKPSLQYEHDMKLWWPHTETIYAALLAYQLSGDKKYLQWYEKVFDYAYSHFPDKENGEWYKYLHRDGSLSTTVKGNRWAGPFHLPRMQFNCWKLLENNKDLLQD